LCDESCFWLKSNIDEELLKKELVEPLLKEADELTAVKNRQRTT
jgi:hypothetical protein